MRTPLVDPKSYDLACHFLSDCPAANEGDRTELAAQIQVVCEDYCKTMNEPRAGSRADDTEGARGADTDGGRTAGSIPATGATPADTRARCAECNGASLDSWGGTCLGCGGQGKQPFREWGKEMDDDRLFDVRIWDDEGDVVRVYWSVTANGVEKIRDEYADRPHLTVVADEC